MSDFPVLVISLYFGENVSLRASFPTIGSTFTKRKVFWRIDGGESTTCLNR